MKLSHMLERYETLEQCLRELDIVNERKKHEARNLRTDIIFTAISGCTYTVSFTSHNIPMTGMTASLLGIYLFLAYRSFKKHQTTKKKASELEKTIKEIMNDPAYKQAAEFCEEIYST